MKPWSLVVCCLIVLLISSSSIQGQEPGPASETNEQPKLNVEIFWISVALEDGVSVHKSVADLIQCVDCSSVRVLGGACGVVVQQGKDQTYSVMSTAESGAASKEISAAEASDSYVVVNINEAQFGTIIQSIKQDARSVIFQAPVATVRAGESAQISSGSKRPFVTSVEQIKGDFAVAYQPGVSLFFEGIAFDIDTSELTGDKFDLDLVSRISKIKRVTEIDLKKDERSESVRIQFPEVESKSSKMVLPFEIGQAVMVLLGTREEEVRESKGFPVPGLDKVFRNTTNGKVRKQDVLLVRIKRAN